MQIPIKTHIDLPLYWLFDCKFPYRTLAYAGLLRISDQDGIIAVPQQIIAEHCGMKRYNINHIITFLHNNGFLRRINRLTRENPAPYHLYTLTPIEGETLRIPTSILDIGLSAYAFTVYCFYIWYVKTYGKKPTHTIIKTCMGIGGNSITKAYNALKAAGIKLPT